MLVKTRHPAMSTETSYTRRTLLSTQTKCYILHQCCIRNRPTNESGQDCAKRAVEWLRTCAQLNLLNIGQFRSAEVQTSHYSNDSLKGCKLTIPELNYNDKWLSRNEFYEKFIRRNIHAKVNRSRWMLTNAPGSFIKYTLRLIVIRLTCDWRDRNDVQWG